MESGTITLSDGNELPIIAFGTGSKMMYTDVTEYVEQAIDAGFCHLDTAAHYKTEKYVGAAIRQSGLPRSSLFITTKYCGGAVRAAACESLVQLGLTHVDLYLVHEPRVFPNFESDWPAIEAIKKDGLARSIGVSNFEVEHLRRLLKIAKERPVVNQIHLHPYNYAQQKELLAYCSQQGIVVAAYGSLVSLTRNPGGPVDAVVNAAAKRLGATPSQVIFLWVRSKGAAVVTTSRRRERLMEYLAVEDLPPLTRQEIAAIDKAGAKGYL